MAWYIAASAAFSSESRSMPSWGKKLMPTEAVTEISMPRMRAGTADRVDQLPRRFDRGVRPLQVHQQRDQLVATAPAEQVRLADDLAHAAGDDRQHLVADPMAVAIVEQPEIVEVDEQQRAALALGVGSSQHPAGPLVEGLAVRQLRQRVDRRQALDPLLRADLVGDVLADAAIAAELAIRVEHRIPAGQVVHQRTVGHPAAEHDVAERPPRHQRGAVLVP